jgi:hypothetical protein
VSRCLCLITVVNTYQLQCRENLSLHEKKRAYVECIEQYVEYLHQQLRLVGHEPVPMQQVKAYKGPNTRSVRVRDFLYWVP